MEETKRQELERKIKEREEARKITDKVQSEQSHADTKLSNLPSKVEPQALISFKDLGKEVNEIKPEQVEKLERVSVALQGIARSVAPFVPLILGAIQKGAGQGAQGQRAAQPKQEPPSYEEQLEARQGKRYGM